MCDLAVYLRMTSILDPFTSLKILHVYNFFINMSLYLDVGGAGACRKRRRRGEKVFKFKSFGENGCPVEFDGSFRENVKALLEYGHLESNLCNGMSSWSFQLEVHRHPPLHILFFVVEEPVEASVDLHCKHCQYVGEV